MTSSSSGSMSSNHEELTPLQKVAIILVSLDKDAAVSIMRHLSPPNLQRVTAAIRNLGEIQPKVKEQAFKEISEMLQTGVTRIGGEMIARKLLQEVVGDEKQANELLEEAEKDQIHAFSAVKRVNGKDLANLLSKEQPSTAALILAFMPPQKAAEVMMCFDEDFREEIIPRLSQPRTADPQIVERVERIFMDKVIGMLHTVKETEHEVLGGPKFVAEMLQHLDRETEESLLEKLTEVSKETAEQVRDLMFTFEDIVKLSDQDIQKILREVPMEKLQIALRGVPQEIFDKIANNLSKRARENLLEEMQLAGKVKRKEVEAEQRAIVAIIRSLEAAGEIEISGSGGEDYV